MGKIYRPISTQRVQAEKLLAESQDIHPSDVRRSVMLLEAMVLLSISIDQSLLRLTMVEE
jgi:hypothetical protein